MTVRAESIVIGTGSEPVIPDVPGLRDSSYAWSPAPI